MGLEKEICRLAIYCYWVGLDLYEKMQKNVGYSRQKLDGISFLGINCYGSFCLFVCGAIITAA